MWNHKLFSHPLMWYLFVVVMDELWRPAIYFEALNVKIHINNIIMWFYSMHMIFWDKNWKLMSFIYLLFSDIVVRVFCCLHCTKIAVCISHSCCNEPSNNADTYFLNWCDYYTVKITTKDKILYKINSRKKKRVQVLYLWILEFSLVTHLSISLTKHLLLYCVYCLICMTILLLLIVECMINRCKENIFLYIYKNLVYNLLILHLFSTLSCF